jgi:hypothetical protein
LYTELEFIGIILDKSNSGGLLSMNESQEYINTIEQKLIQKKIKRFQLKEILIISGISATAIAIITGFVLIAVTIGNMKTTFNKTVSELKSKIEVLDKKISYDADKIDELSKAVDGNIKDVSNSVQSVRNQAIVLRIQNNFQEAIVTDEIYIKKFTITSQLPKLTATIDIETQPSITFKYTGKGKFNMSDRELTNMIVTLLNQGKASYNNAVAASGLNSENWDQGVFTVTIKNYEIGIYKDGVFTVTKASSLN